MARRRQRYEGLSGGAGLIRYFDVDEGGPKIAPKFVLSAVVAIILLEIFANLFFV